MVYLFVFVLVCTIGFMPTPSSANQFLQSTPASKHDRVLTDLTAQSVYLDLASSLGEEKIENIQRAIRPTYTSLSKDEHGNLDRAGVRYALHRYFVQRHGWYVKFLRPSDGAWKTSSPTAIMKDRVPKYIQNFFEHRLSRNGFGMNELALFAATLEDLIRQESNQQLSVAYRALRLNATSRYPPQYVDVALDAYMMAYITGGNLTAITPGKFKAQEKLAQEIYPAWPETKAWLRDVRMSVGHMERHRSNLFESNMSFADAVRVVDEIGHQFGSFQALECHSIRDSLIEKEHQGSGRVRLSRFYARTLDEEWEFSESVDYLRKLGVLDETDPQRVSVVIPNYVNSMSNCIAPSGFFSVCCRDECESLFMHLESKIAAPEATPGLIVELVAGLASDTVEAPRNISAALVLRLWEIADHHGGRVPLHGRLFSQWMHHAYPRECNFPHASGTTTSLNLLDVLDAGENPAVSEEELLKYQNLLEDTGALNLTEMDEMESALPWSAVEELVVMRDESRHLDRHVLKHIFIVAAVLIAMFTVARAVAPTSEDKVAGHFV